MVLPESPVFPLSPVRPVAPASPVAPFGPAGPGTVEGTTTVVAAGRSQALTLSATTRIAKGIQYFISVPVELVRRIDPHHAFWASQKEFLCSLVHIVEVREWTSC
jgi:hypothetical protein